MEVRKAKIEDLSDLFKMINKSYEMEVGSSGVAFNEDPRYAKMEELETDLEHFWVLEANQDILGAVKIKLVEDGNVAVVGPLAVSQRHQV